MKNLLNIFKKKTIEVDKKEWYTADMITECGFSYKSGVRASSEKEAVEMIFKSSAKGNSILTITKGSIMGA